MRAVVVSRSYPSPEVQEYLKAYNVTSSVEAGSSLKFCLVAEDRADIYPRLGPMWEWDSGQATPSRGRGLQGHDAGLKPSHVQQGVPQESGFVVSAFSKG